MYKVMVVEDIDIIRQDIKRLINWQEHGYQVAAEARNGEMGLAMFQKYRPDIVITDIRMPVMTGLDMIREIQKTGGETQFILLTDYEEFEYAKTALSMGVHSYLLKYELDDNILLRELEKARTVIEKAQQIERMAKSEYLKDRLVHGKPETDDSQSFFGWYGLSTLILVEAKGFYHKTSELYNRLKRHMDVKEQDYEFDYIETAPHEQVLFLKATESKSRLKGMNYIRTFVSYLQTLFKETYGVETAVAIGPLIGGSGEIADAYLKTKQLLRQKVFYSKSCTIDALPPEPTDAQKEEIRLLRQSIRSNIQTFNIDELNRLIPRLFTGLLLEAKSTALLEESVKELAFSIASRGSEMQIDSLSKVLDEITECTRNYNVYILADLFGKAVEMFDSDMGSRYSKRVNLIMKYVAEHYFEDISLYDLSKELDLSVIYISQLFKKEMGITFTAYLTKFRVEKAIQLFKTGHYKVYEVSRMVGYQTVQYFSNIFKKETGRKPGDFC